MIVDIKRNNLKMQRNFFVDFENFNVFLVKFSFHNNVFKSFVIFLIKYLLKSFNANNRSKIIFNQ